MYIFGENNKDQHDEMRKDLEKRMNYRANPEIVKNNESLRDITLSEKIFNLLKSENIVDGDYDETSCWDTDGNPCIRIMSTLPNSEGYYSRFQITIWDGFKSRFTENKD